MARRQVIEVVCDRSKRKDLQEKEELTDEAEIELHIRGKVTSFKDLCGRCREACTSYANRILKVDDKAEDKKPIAPAVQLTTAPDTKKKGIFG